MLGFLGAGFLVMLIGLIDDKKPIKPKIKFAWQIVVCLIFLYTNNLFTFLGPFWVTVPILMLWMIGLMNAFNFLDNMDGILAGMSGILALGFYAVSVMTKRQVCNLHNYVALVSLSFAGSVFGFCLIILIQQSYLWVMLAVCLLPYFINYRYINR